MSNKTKLPVEVVQCIEEEANDYVEETRGRQGRVETYIAGATAYATKLQEAQKENEKLKAMANGWRPLLEEVLRGDAIYGDALPIETINKIKRFLYGE